MNSSALKSEFKESMKKITCVNVLEIYLSFILTFEIMTAQESLQKEKCASTLSWPTHLDSAFPSHSGDTICQEMREHRNATRDKRQEKPYSKDHISKKSKCQHRHYRAKRMQFVSAKTSWVRYGIYDHKTISNEKRPVSSQHLKLLKSL